MPKSQTLSRLIFHVRPDCHEKFNHIFEAELKPILDQLGLVPSNMPMRKMAENFWGRLFEHTSVADILRVKAQLQDGQGIWAEVVQQHRGLFDGFFWEADTNVPRFDTCVWRFDPYCVPAGSGTRVQSQGETYRVGPGKGHWEHYGISDGLLNVNVLAVVTDRNGYLWIGTEKGVMRFDSRNWQSIEIEDHELNITIMTMHEDQKGYLWFGIANQGLVRYDGTRFERFKMLDFLTHRSITDIGEDLAGRLWFSTEGGGVICYDGTSWQTYTTQDGLADDVVYVLHLDADGYLWVGTEKGLCVLNPDTETVSFCHFGSRMGLPEVEVKALVQDDQGYLWVATKVGLVQCTVNKNQGVVEVHPLTIFTEEEGLPYHRISCAMADDGMVWFGTEGDGVILYDGQGFRMDDSAEGVLDNFVKVIHKDNEGHYWFGTGNGVSRYSGHTFWSLSRADGLPNNAVVSLAQGPESGVWMGTRGGVAYLEGRQLTVWNTENGLLHNEVRHVAIDKNGHKWFATYGGLVHYDGMVMTTYTVEDGLPHNEVRCVIQDDVGDIWCVTWQGRSVCRFDGQSFMTYHLADGLPYWKFWTLLQDRKGTIWVGTRDGVSRSIKDENKPAFETFTQVDGLVDNEVRHMIEDDQGRLWMSTFGGMVMYDGDTFRSYGKEDGLAHDEFRGLCQDRSGHIWFGTYGAGVNRWNPQYEISLVQTLTERDGLINNRVVSILEDRSGGIWFGTSSGITRFIQPHSQAPRVQVEAVVADRRYHDVSELTIPNSAEVVAFEFGSISVKTRSAAVQYRYRLNGFDEGWQVTSEDRVEYYDLPEGDYTFEVYAFDRDLVRSAQPAMVALRVVLAHERIAQRLKQSERERLEAVATRDQLDARLQELNYLYALRERLSDARTLHAILTQAGSAVAQALDQVGSVVVVYDGQEFLFGKNGHQTPYTYERKFVWNTRVRGQIDVRTQVPLSESQEHLLLDETVSHVVHALEMRELEAQLLQSARLISMGQMAAGVAHELNQPLGAISNVVSDVYLRLRDGINLSQKELTRMMQDSMGIVHRMSETINHLRVFSRDESDTMPEDFNLNDVIQASLKIIGVQLKQHGIDLKLNLQTDLPSVLGYAHQMEQVVVNLLANARDAVDAMGDDKHIVVNSFCAEDQVVVEVQDNGEGIKEEDLNRVFDPFFTTKEADKGTGLGLSISYAIVKKHSGDIACESQVGKTVFRIVLPTELKRSV